MSLASSSSSKWSLEIPSSEILNLIQHFLIENGLKESSSVLQKETSTGCRGLFTHAHTLLMKSCKEGNWGTVLETLSIVTLHHKQHEALQQILAEVHEMAILELAQEQEMDLAFMTLKMCRTILQEANSTDENEKESLYDSLERKLHALNALRGVQATAQQFTNVNTAKPSLPPNFYGKFTKQEKRLNIAKTLGNVIPIIPSSRLTALLQQAIKWQVHTGELPQVKYQFDDEESEPKAKKQKKKQFDLVLGTVTVDTTTEETIASKKTTSTKKLEAIPLDPYSTLKFGKKTLVTSCLFYTDSTVNQTSLITGTSDGFIEVWDANSKYTKLRMDLDYQQKDEIMCHDVDDNQENAMPPSILAMAVNNESTMLATGDQYGTIYIWNLNTGTCLVEFEKVHSGAINHLDFYRDGTRILSASQDCSIKEFGLRTKRLLKDFRGHTSFVNSCHYILPNPKSKQDSVQVISASADSTVRIWCGKTAELLLTLNPMAASNGPSAIVNAASVEFRDDGDQTGRNIHTLLPLHTPANTMIVVPRGPIAYLVTMSGLILRKFENESVLTKDSNNDEQESAGLKESAARGDFVCSTVSSSNKWLYLTTDQGVCIVYDVATGKVEQTISDFGVESAGGKSGIELNGVAHHPLKGIIAAYSSSKVLKKGLLTVWK